MSRGKPKSQRTPEVYPYQCSLLVPAFVKVNDDHGRKIWTWSLDGMTDDTPMVPCLYACRDIDQMTSHLLVTHRMTLERIQRMVALLRGAKRSS